MSEKIEETNSSSQFLSSRGSEIEAFVDYISVPIPENPTNEHWYVASPFSSDDPNETEKWLNEITEIVGKLIMRYPSIAIFRRYHILQNLP